MMSEAFIIIMVYKYTHAHTKCGSASSFLSLLSPSCVQLYEQILAENEKLKAQLRDTDLELADLKLQLEKATQVRLSRRTAELAMVSSL